MSGRERRNLVKKMILLKGASCGEPLFIDPDEIVSISWDDERKVSEVTLRGFTLGACFCVDMQPGEVFEAVKQAYKTPHKGGS